MQKFEDMMRELFIDRCPEVAEEAMGESICVFVTGVANAGVVCDAISVAGAVCMVTITIV